MFNYNGYEEDENVRSLNSHQVSLVRFQNKTGKRVNLIWIDYQGRNRIQLELETGQEINYNTYVTHPWRAEDTESKNALLLNFLETFYPPVPDISREDIRQRRALVRRLVVNITTPVYKLEKYCKEAIKKQVAKHKVEKLPLPKVILQDLLEDY